ncbi:MAG: aminoacyl-histidine dipeptidase [Acidobacteriota bacterium]|nr:MAG: aminoacyl-histidine dipeptidase [Acidobacteriota bacterium]
MSFVSDFQPKALWKHFDAILAIPRGSKNEEAIRQYVVTVGKKNNLETKVDSAGNVVVCKPGTTGYEASPITVLQCHLDMVNEKNNDVEHDFDKDPIIPLKDGEYLKASGTTLGADNGIGMATCLALLEAEEIEHGPLECLFTVDEETGLTGASALSSELLEGTQLLNLDSEEEGSVCVGCAGGAGMNISIPVEAAPAKGLVGLRVVLRGLKGGHSGIDIHLQRGNAIQILSRMLLELKVEGDFRLAEFSGGNMRNAIPREASAVIGVKAELVEKTEAKLRSSFSAIALEIKPAEPAMELAVSPSEPLETVLSSESGNRALLALYASPHGVAAMSYDIEGLVETSSNLATAKLGSDSLDVHVSTRSSVASALDAIMRKTDAVSQLAGATTEWVEGYPGWKPNMDSPLLKVVCSVHETVLGSQPKVEAVHAGLECGIIKEKYPEMDMVSIGPQIEFPHSPDERVHVASVDRFYGLVTAILKDLAARS